MSHLISVIMPYFKKKKYFMESINSVLNQTYKNLEILIVYDDSNKNEIEFIETCVKNDSRVKIIINKTNIDFIYLINLNSLRQSGNIN